MWGLSPSDNNAQINVYKAQYGIGNPCAGTQGGGPEAIEIVIEGQPFIGYPTYCIVCPDKSMYFDICYPPAVDCFDQYFENCALLAMNAQFSANATFICVDNSVNFQDLSTGNVVSWNWVFEGGEPPISTEQHPVVTYHTAGYFDVTLTVSNGTNSDTRMWEDYIRVDPCTGINEDNSTVFETFPNPTNGEFQIHFSSAGNYHVMIVDLMGVKIYEEDFIPIADFSSTIHLSGAESGIYFLLVKTPAKTWTKKINLMK